MAVRLSIRGAERNPAQIGLIRDAIGNMKSIGDDRGFDFFAALHGVSMPIWCQHGTRLFLPWHRAYLYYFELAMQTRLGPRFTVLPNPADPRFADVGLPWWDWTSPLSHQRGIPDSYADPDPADPLNGSEIGSADGRQAIWTGVWSADLTAAVRNQLPGAITDQDPPRTLRDPDAPSMLPSQAEVDDAQDQVTFDDYSNVREGIHGAVHDWVGGAMGAVPIAAYDPIFWTHHAMIDRLWYMWQNSPRGEDPPADLMGVVLAPFPMTVADTLNIADLDYEYAVQASA